MSFHPMKRYCEDLTVVCGFVCVCVFVFFLNLTKLNFPLKCEQYFHSVKWSESLSVDLDDCSTEAGSVYLFRI